ncbi:MAG: hypothetical protein NC816_07220 [Candidatus Omnitrophica bacterium]|nr:hypothetical protein [Candidatus Omnitrophota bacterium]
MESVFGEKKLIKQLSILGLPGEIYTEIGRKIREILPFENTIIAQNSNFI